MPKKGYEHVGTSLKPEWNKMIDDVLLKTNETRSDFFKRVIQSEYNKATGAAQIEAPDQLRTIQRQLSDIYNKVESTNLSCLQLKNSSEIIKKRGDSIFAAISYCIKFILSMRYYIALLVINIKRKVPLEAEEIDIIVSEKGKKAFNSYLDNVSTLDVNSVVEYLQKDWYKPKE